ncbi:hypothetical protein [Nocardia sp. NBC_00511]|uniref:hypothetical protein n=1 Tax=Nocardia sp. NBC_00511 TaxID=2903591 RepID=UPI0030E3BDE2
MPENEEPFRRGVRRLDVFAFGTDPSDPHRALLIYGHDTVAIEVIDDPARVVVGDTRPYHGTRGLAACDEHLCEFLASAQQWTAATYLNCRSP